MLSRAVTRPSARVALRRELRAVFDELFGSARSLTRRQKDYIRKGEVHLLKALMAKSREQGMQTFDHALYQLYAEGEISYEAALLHADSPNDLRLMIKLGADANPNPMDRVEGLRLEEEPQSSQFNYRR